MVDNGLVWLSAMISSVSVILLCSTGRVSPLFVQSIIILTILLHAYAGKNVTRTEAVVYHEQFTSEMSDEDSAVDTVTDEAGVPPMASVLQHCIQMNVETHNKSSVWKNQGRSTIDFTQTERTIVGPASNECFVSDDFSIYCTISGEPSSGNVYEIWCIDSAQQLISIGLDFVEDTGITYVKGYIGDTAVIIKRPDGVHTIAYVLDRDTKSLSLRAVSPLQTAPVSDTTLCEVDVHSVVTQPMKINKDGLRFGSLINFGIYSAALSGAQATELDTYLQRVCLLQSPIVQNINKGMMDARTALDSVKKTNPFGSDKVGEKCDAYVSDWSQPNYSAVPDSCKREIVSNCTIHPDAKGCECWNKQANQYNSDACVNYRAVFTGKKTQPIETVEKPAKRPVYAEPIRQTVFPKTNYLAPKQRRWYDYILGTSG